ncbi:pentapeptide repeat-containing protein [Winogradskyella sp. PG-2]|uniref:pentapeptide repeat-containing protein n=1 Tax=Winogradskyella sp. PG-2 TaxID=754409 RepID=UPI0004589729|nr:pentapeptide repeat-containing protein [Winogradskyella sp. PG-2]BAO74461.1 related to MCBG protein [Winogradskyella sp. PG-2]
MNLPFIDNQEFKNQNYETAKLTKGEYTECTFVNCNFENSDLSNNSFLECEFIDCNLSNVNVTYTIFNDVSFRGSKLVGVQFQNCNDFLLAFGFIDCTLNLSSFYQLKISNTKFLNCKMHRVDFTETEAKHVTFSKCDLKDAIFDASNVESSDFSTAYNFSIHPSDNKIKNSTFSKENCFGLLNSFQVRIK